ncbi:hypothetical protein [Deinococcus aquaedulcis]|uniref:hypothetical protein n=1 Tax=Deinococcus aquaedulcis TaxID=2840455 RepID=UPI001C8364EC|nr:hypothetical protein [Deinococcus aquaedulcis]
MARLPYYCACFRISLRKRWSFILGSMLCGAGVLAAFQTPLLALITGTALLGLLHAAVLCMQSWQRHRYDGRPLRMAGLWAPVTAPTHHGAPTDQPWRLP